jgi:hypothetical protein
MRPSVPAHTVSDMTFRFRATAALLAVPALLAVTAGQAAASNCTNADKPADSGIQVLLGPDDSIEWATPGIYERIAAGLIDPDTGAGFHGLIGFDFDGDGVADLSTYIVGPEDEIPDQAQDNGAMCHGVVSIEDWFTDCVS